jgi:squalene-hopene/tetraprenyl-beta-curcumene cyclase
MFVAASLSLVLFAPLSAGQRAAAGGSGALSAATRQELMKSLASGAAFLRSQQSAEGTFDANPGVSAVATAALLRQPGVPRGMLMDAGGGKALDAIAKLAKPDGGIYDKAIPHYITAVSVMALAAGGRPGDKPLIEKGRRYLADHIWDEGEGIQPNDKWYGGIGYGGSSPDRRADIISLEYALRAMKEAELPANDAAWEKAIKFLQRTQNNSETNDQGWAANDGGFVYYPGFTYHTDGGTKSYGSATYAGVISYAWANVKKDDARVQAVLKWVRDNYTVDENPGMGQKTVYYYYLVFAKALQAVGQPTIVDAKGRSHNWREDLGKKLISLQHPEGYWVNTDKAEMQDNKVLVTAFTMQAIEAALQP